MVANLLGPALAWSIFFSNNDPVRATSLPENYLHMGLMFAIASLICILFVVVATRKYIHDSRQLTIERDGLSGLFRDIMGIVSDFYPRYVFVFIVTVTVGVALVSSLQMYLYEHFMRFGGVEKSLAHGGTMIGFAVGALLGATLTKKLEKKGTVYFGGITSVGSNFILAGLFLSGILAPGQSATVFSWSIPYAFLVFVLFHSLYWLGNGVIFPTATSMIADVSEIHEIKTGMNKDGAYAAIFTFAQKCAISLGVLVSGYLLTLIGFEAGSGLVQRPEAVWLLCGVTLLVGPLISLVSLGLIRLYPVDRESLERFRSRRIVSPPDAPLL
jgi:GPH family glycoside/pentoside/hexuronide:cation symporter